MPKPPPVAKGRAAHAARFVVAVAGRWFAGSLRGRNGIDRVLEVGIACRGWSAGHV